MPSERHRNDLVRTINGSHHKAYLRSVRGTSEVGVYLLGLVLVQRDESVEDVVASRSIIGTTL